jgi:hypothetical protein
LYFADQGALEAAFGSDEGKAAAADYQKIAPPGSRMFVAVLDPAFAHGVGCWVAELMGWLLGRSWP